MKTNKASEPVLAKKMVSWKKDHTTSSHTLQDYVGQDRSSIPRPLTDMAQNCQNSKEIKICSSTKDKREPPIAK